uniref:Reverse transcriptase zinc-binding domain-containing protein n=1 Tax=Latimeria chalumnae TaxID=7897 RepID=H3AW88_LATCH
ISFASLQETFQLPSMEFFRYLQLCSCLREVPALSPGLLPTSSIVDIRHRIQSKNKKMSRLYSLLLSRVSPDCSSTKSQWERELGHSLSEEGWEEVFASLTQTGTDLYIRLIQFKIVKCLYWSLARLAASGLKDSGLRWKCGMERGDTLHMLWGCEKVRPLWSSVIQHIRDAMGYSLDNPINCILSIDLSRAQVSKVARGLIQLALLSAKRVTLRHWRRAEPPSTREWLLLMADTAAHERVIMRTRNKLAQFQSVWSAFL